MTGAAGSLRRLLALRFVLVVVGVLLGLAVIVSSGFGYELVFEGVLPTLQKGA